MTTSVITTVVDHSSDAGFRTWGAEFHAQLVAIGLTLTSDTGQINWTTVTRPASLGVGGYEIWRFNDTLQSTTPIFIKLEYGTSYQAAMPGIWITVGQGSSGAGAITGVTSSRFTTLHTAAAAGPTIVSTSTSYVSRFCYNATLGFFGFAWKYASTTGVPNCCTAFASVFRSNDSTGAATSTTVNVLAYGIFGYGYSVANYGTMQSINYTTGLLYPQTGTLQWWGNHPFALTSTVNGSNISVDPVFYVTPSPVISVCLGRALKTEVPQGTAISATLVGSTPHTYIQVGVPFSTYSFTDVTSYAGQDLVGQGLNATYTGLLMLWE